MDNRQEDSRLSATLTLKPQQQFLIYDDLERASVAHTSDQSS